MLWFTLCYYRTVGEIIAVSIAQGGPPPNFFREWCYGYISTGEIDKEMISKDDVTDPELRRLMEEVILLKCSFILHEVGLM